MEHIVNFDAKVRAKMAAILAKEEEEMIEAEAYRRILEERTMSTLESNDIKVLAKLAGECWATIEESYPNIRHTNGYALADPHCSCEHCTYTRSIVHAVPARKKIMELMEAMATAKEEEYSSMSIYSKYKPVLDYLKTTPGSSYNIHNLLMVEYPAELKKMYNIDVSNIVASYRNRITVKHQAPNDIRQCLKDYIIAEKLKQVLAQVATG